LQRALILLGFAANKTVLIASFQVVRVEPGKTDLLEALTRQELPTANVSG